MDLPDNIRPGNGEQVNISFYIMWEIPETLSSEIALTELVLLHKTAHCSVEDKDPMLEQFVN
jgi:hypothetical protein